MGDGGAAVPGLHHVDGRLREMVNAWRHLLRDFGPWEMVWRWHDRIRANGIRTDGAALLARAVRRDRLPEPAAAILESESMAPGPQRGRRGIGGTKRMKASGDRTTARRACRHDARKDREQQPSAAIRGRCAVRTDTGTVARGVATAFADRRAPGRGRPRPA